MCKVSRSSIDSYAFKMSNNEDTLIYKTKKQCLRRYIIVLLNFYNVNLPSRRFSLGR